MHNVFMSIEFENSPEIEMPGYEVPFADVVAHPSLRLEEGSFITGIQGKLGFKTLEAIIVTHTDRTKRLDTVHADRNVYVTGPGSKGIFHNPLPNELVPKGFHGELRDGVAVVNKVLMGYYNLSLFADLRSSAGTVGQIQREVIYRGGRRTMGPNTSLKEARKNIELLKAESSQIRRLLLARGIANPILTAMETSKRRH
jgi:hypothetical protein